MDWKNQFTKTPYLVLFIVLISVGVGTASALITITLAGNVIITDDLLVEGQANVSGGPIFSTRSTSDGNTSNLIIQRTEGSTAETPSFSLSHRTSDKDLWLYGFDGSTFKNFVGFDYPNYKIIFPATGNTLVVDAANNRIGIGTSSPTEELDVVGNVTISGNLTAGGTVECPNCILGFYNKVAEFQADGGFLGVAMICDSGDLITGGGYDAPSGPPPIRNGPDGPTAWQVHWDSTVNGITYFVSIQCADYPPAHIP